jgi:hypothetical protein
MQTNALTRVVIFACGFVLAATNAFAGPEQITTGKESKDVPIEQAPACDPRWWVNVGGGAEWDIGSTDFSRDFHYTVFGFFPGIGPFSVSQRSPALQWDDVYDTTWRLRSEFGYALTQHLDVLAAFNYAHADANDFQDWGTFSVTSFFGTATAPLNVRFDDYDSIGGEIGFRYYILSRQARFRPYVSFSGGASHVDNIDITAVVDESGLGGPADLAFFHGPFFEGSWVGSGTATLGFEANLTCHWTIGVNGGAHYQTRLDQDDSELRRFRSLQGTPVRTSRIQSANDDVADRWTAPVTGYIKFRF